MGDLVFFVPLMARKLEHGGLWTRAGCIEEVEVRAENDDFPENVGGFFVRKFPWGQGGNP